jgi:signal transduction histidine kinase
LGFFRLPASRIGRRRWNMNLARLKWVALGAVVLLFLFVEYARYNLYPYFDAWSGRLLMDLAILAVCLFLFGAVFHFANRMHEGLERKNRELEALHRAALDIYGELSLDTVLHKTVDQARQLLEARYGAVSVVDQKGELRQFATTGVGPHSKQQIGAPPEGKGLLGMVLQEGQRLRLSDMTEHPRSAGFPKHHPEMKSLLAVPITCRSPFRGNLYVADKRGGGDFNREDEETLLRFATEAAIAIDNTYLHQRLQDLAVAEERSRIGREMHDGMAQILAYVNTKAQAAREFLERGKGERAGAQLEELASAAREVYTDVREGILALRTQAGPERPLSLALVEFIQTWQDLSSITAELEIDDDLDLEPNMELQLLRIVQEALANVRKHSNALFTRVELRQEKDILQVVVQDDGDGFDPARRERGRFPRFGLTIMRERAESIGGRLNLESWPGKGTRVSIEMPLGTKTS